MLPESGDGLITWEVLGVLLFPDRIFRGKNRSGELPIPFWFKCAGILVHPSFLT